MFHKHSILVILLIIIDTSSSFKYDDICLINNSIDVTPKCHDKYSFKCGARHCTKNNLNCAYFVLYTILEDKLGKKETNNYFEAKIKHCPFKKNENINDICANRKKCLFKPTIWQLSFVKKIWKECSCGKDYSFRCGDGLCARNREICNIFNSNYKNENVKIKDCKIN